MKLNQLLAGAAIGCMLGTAGISLGSGIANAAPQCPPGVQCGPGEGGGHGGPPPGGPPGDRGPGGPVPAVRPVTSADPEVVLAVHRPVTSTALAAMIGGRRSVLRTTTGAGDSTAPRGATDCRHGAGARRRRRFGMGRCLRRGGRRLRRSTTSASTSNRCGTPATTSGVSISSGSGFHYRSDRRPGETAASDNPRGGRQRFSAANNGSAGA